MRFAEHTTRSQHAMPPPQNANPGKQANNQHRLSNNKSIWHAYQRVVFFRLSRKLTLGWCLSFCRLAVAQKPLPSRQMCLMCRLMLCDSRIRAMGSAERACCFFCVCVCVPMSCLYFRSIFLRESRPNRVRNTLSTLFTLLSTKIDLFPVVGAIASSLTASGQPHAQRRHRRPGSDLFANTEQTHKTLKPICV